MGLLMNVFLCRRCGRRTETSAPGPTVRCSHCQGLALAFTSEDETTGSSEIFQARPPTAEVTEEPVGFAIFSPVVAGRSAVQKSRLLRSLAWMRAATVAGAVVGAALGAGLGAAGLDGTADDFAAAATGGLIGLLIGLTIGLVLGFAYFSEGKRRSGRDVADDLLDILDKGEPPDVGEVIALIFGMAGAQRLWRFEPWDYLMVGIALGGVGGAVFGAEVFLQAPGPRNGLSTAVGALGGGLIGGGCSLLAAAWFWRQSFRG